MSNKFFVDNFIPPKDSYSKNNEKKRIEFIDLAKGVCITMVILFHSQLLIGCPVIDAMRMPLYFILSGLFFKDYGSFYNLLERKINKLLVPFVFFLFIGLILHWIRLKSFDLIVLLDPIFTNSMLNVPIWFLLCLLWINLIYCIISLNVHNIIYKALIVCFIGCIGYILAYYDIHLSLFLGSAFSALLFSLLAI